MPNIIRHHWFCPWRVLFCCDLQYITWKPVDLAPPITVWSKLIAIHFALWVRKPLKINTSYLTLLTIVRIHATSWTSSLVTWKLLVIQWFPSALSLSNGITLVLRVRTFSVGKLWINCSQVLLFCLSYELRAFSAWHKRV